MKTGLILAAVVLAAPIVIRAGCFVRDLFQVAGGEYLRHFSPGRRNSG